MKEPNFKVGDIVYHENWDQLLTIVKINDSSYGYYEVVDSVTKKRETNTNDNYVRKLSKLEKALK